MARSVSGGIKGMFSRKARRRRSAALLALMLAAAFATDKAGAEPYLAVYKGMQCSGCHSHPAGGGKRNAYGNAFAQTEMPAERVGAADAALWTGEVAEWLSIGANLRADYRYVDTPETDHSSEFGVSRGTVYVEASLIPNRLSLYVDQQVAPGSGMNREAYVRLNSAGSGFHFAAGQFFLPYGLRLQDDTAFVRQVTGVNFSNPDRGVQVGYEAGPWSTQLTVTNGGGGGETDTGKQLSWVAHYVRQRWRAGASFNFNEADAGNRQMQNVFFGLRTGPVVWLAQADLVTDDLPSGAEQDVIATLVEGNWLFRQGHNLKVSYDYFDPNDDVDEDHQARWSLLWEYTPMQFLQSRVGVRIYDGIPQVNAQNRDEYFAEIHGFF
jgi:hypothetical protein